MSLRPCRLGIYRPLAFASPWIGPCALLRIASKATRLAHSHAFEEAFDQDQLHEARKWRASVSSASLPPGRTSYSRSSGPGGQHVNKTDSKATTVWTVDELSRALPALVRSGLRSSRYYSKRSDCISIQAQTQRSRTANTDDNHRKLWDEIMSIYRERVPGETSTATRKKHEGFQKASNENRVKSKKLQSSKKFARKGRGDD